MPPAAKRTAADNASVEAYQAYQKRLGIFPFPAAEIRSVYEIHPDGSIGKYRTPSYVPREIDAGSIRKDYTGITIPVLALFAVPRSLADQEDRRDSKRLGWETDLKHADPLAQVVELPGTHHYMFQNEETDVLHHMRAFLHNLN